MIGSILHNAVTPIGVDLGASGARLLQLRCATGRSAVIAAARADAGGEADDEARLGALAQQIARRLDTGAFRGRRCVVSLDDRALRVKSMRLPAMSDEETDQAVRVDGAERLGFAPEQAEIGWIRAGEVRQGDEAKEEIILVGASREHVERVIESVSAVGLVPLAIEPGFQACARAIGRQRRRKGEREQTHLLVDVGSRASGVALIRGDRVAFYKQIEWGGDTLDAAASAALGLDAATVRDLRRQRRTGGEVDERVDRAVFDAVRPLLDALAHEVTLCLRYALVTFRGDRPESVIVAGGEAEEPRLVERLGEALGVPASAARPLEGMSLADATFAGADRKGSLAQWSTAAGLALRYETPARTRGKPREERRAPRSAA